MGRALKPRISYTSDVQHLTRLLRAVELDPLRSKTWKAETAQYLNKTISLFLTADSAIESPKIRALKFGNEKRNR